MGRLPDPTNIRAQKITMLCNKMLQSIKWETHPIIPDDVYAVEVDGDIVYLSRSTLEAAVPLTVEAVMERESISSVDEQYQEILIGNACQARSIWS